MQLNRVTVIIMVTVACVIITVTGVAIWDHAHEDEILGKSAAINVISLVLVIPFYFWKKWHDEKNETSHISRNLHGELLDALDGLNVEKYKEDIKTIPNQINVGTANEKKITFSFMGRNLNHDVYDSLICSGKINFLTYELQQVVQDIFKRIKDHNHYLKYIGELMDRGVSANDPRAINYYVWMNSSETKLRDTIPDMLKELKKYFN